MIRDERLYVRGADIERAREDRPDADVRRDERNAWAGGDDDAGGYCLERVYREARQRCIDRGEGWRWGVGRRPV